MKVNQISVFLENKNGRLAEVSRVLSQGGINLRAVSIADTADFGILRIIADKPDEALAILSDNGFTARETNVIGVVVQDTPGGLNEILDLFEETGVNIEYLYSSLAGKDKKAVVIFKVGDIDYGLKILSDHGKETKVVF